MLTIAPNLLYPAANDWNDTLSKVVSRLRNAPSHERALADLRYSYKAAKYALYLYLLSKVAKIAIRKAYNSLSGYQDYRDFYDLSSRYLNDLSPFQNYSVSGYFDRSVMSNLNATLRVLKLYNEKSKLSVQRISAPVFQQGNMFEFVTEEESWNQRCKQYKLLA